MRLKVGLILVGAGWYFTTAQFVRADSLFDYNVVVTDRLTTSSHIEGRAFVNNLSTSNQPDFAQSMAAGNGDTLDVAGAIVGSGLTIERGVFRHADPLPNPFTLNRNNGAKEAINPCLSIASLSNQINATATLYSSLVASNVSNNGSTFHIGAGGTGVSVYSVSAAALSVQNESVIVDVNSASAIIIKVLDKSFTFGSSEHQTVGGSAQKVLWYFPNATSIVLNDSLWSGSILAPLATLSSPNQNIAGGVYVRNFNQTAEVHLPSAGITPLSPMFTGPLAVPAPSLLEALVGVGLGFFSLHTVGLLRKSHYRIK